MSDRTSRGPWQYDIWQGPATVRDADGRVIAEAFTGETGEEEEQANACLFAAAWTLRETLRRMRAELDGMQMRLNLFEPVTGDDLQALKDMLDTALDACEGVRR